MDRFVAFDKGDFIGRTAALAERNGAGTGRRIATLEVDATDADASGYEPVWRDGRRVGFVTSGGYGHTLGKSYALAMIDSESAGVGTELTTHIVGQERPARVVPPSPYDPEGKAMRA